MSQRLVLPLACLALGAAAGFFAGVRSQPELPEASQSAAADSVGKTTSASIRQASDGGSLIRSLDELLKEYDIKGAERLASTLSVAQIQQALQHLRMGPDHQARLLSAQLYRAWAAKDPEAAWQGALALSEKQGRAWALAAVAKTIAKTRPERAVELAMSLGMGGSRSQTLREALTEWSKKDLSAVQAYLKQHPDIPAEPYLFTSAISETARENPQLALQQTSTLSNANARESATRWTVRSWYEKDAAAAKRWVLEQAPPAQRDAALVGLFEAMTEEDPRQALVFFEQTDLAGSGTRDRILQSIFNSWLQKDPAAAFDYFADSANAKMLEQFKYNLAVPMNDLTPAEQADLLARLPAGDIKNDIIRQMADQQVHRGRYAEAVTALNDLPDSSGRDSSLQRLGSTWAKDNPQAAADWLKQQPDSTDRDLVIAGYAQEVAQTNPQAAIQWANAIPDKNIQATVFKNIAVLWLRFNPQAATAWLQTLDLSQQEKDSVLRLAEQSGNGSFSINVKERR